MAQTSDTSAGLSVFQVMRALRDMGMDSWAKVALTITSTDTYSRASSMMGKPGLVMAALARQATDGAMSRLLSYVNMPSRADVLSLSVRLTHIETALDDLGAAVDALRLSAEKKAPASKAPGPGRASGNHRSRAASEG